MKRTLIRLFLRNFYFFLDLKFEQKAFLIKGTVQADQKCLKVLWLDIVLDKVHEPISSMYVLKLLTSPFSF